MWNKARLVIVDSIIALHRADKMLSHMYDQTRFSITEAGVQDVEEYKDTGPEWWWLIDCPAGVQDVEEYKDTGPEWRLSLASKVRYFAQVEASGSVCITRQWDIL
jgi:hypothetical protein